jgi:hypothetical protein
MLLKCQSSFALQGTNAAIAKELIDNSGMPILSAVDKQQLIHKRHLIRKLLY